jgi:hypothetical protein
MPDSTQASEQTTAEALAELATLHHAAEAHRDFLLSTNAPRWKVDQAWRRVGDLASECHKLSAELLSRRAAA